MNKFSLFIISIFSCCLFLALERFFGIKWNYHPDAETYIYESPVIAAKLIEDGFLGFFNNFYYIVSLLLSFNISYLICLNIIFYSLTNILIYNFFKDFSKKKINIFSFWLLVLIPYRLHLAVHILKDTLIIFFLVLTISKNILSKVSFFFILLMRIFSVFYFVIVVPRKYYLYLFFIIIVVFFLYKDFIINFLSETNEANMTFRDFDKVPTFKEYGVIGVFIRALIWPMLVISGFYLFISPSLAFIPVAVGSFIIQLWCKYYLRSHGILIQVYLSCFFIALFVNGFTSYLRYTFPLILIIPLLKLKSLNYSKI